MIKPGRIVTCRPENYRAGAIRNDHGAIPINIHLTMSSFPSTPSKMTLAKKNLKEKEKSSFQGTGMLSFIPVSKTVWMGHT